uniref:Uncharacterized protein n=1 Tax=Timema monikensis TaxID=170555 RepID=A0A7R9EIF7_9NEOP|nr:unnamed protein product [Timema monikensis]
MALSSSPLSPRDRYPRIHTKHLWQQSSMLQIASKNVDGLSPGDWLDCTTFKSGLPRIVMIVAVVLPVLLALWLWLTPGRQFTLEDMEALTEFKDPFDCPPPKYTSLMMEKVSKAGNEKNGIICADPTMNQAKFHGLLTQANTTRKA